MRDTEPWIFSGNARADLARGDCPGLKGGARESDAVHILFDTSICIVFSLHQKVLGDLEISNGHGCAHHSLDLCWGTSNKAEVEEARLYCKESGYEENGTFSVRAPSSMADMLNLGTSVWLFNLIQ